jgi:hypothetical protein
MRLMKIVLKLPVTLQNDIMTYKDMRILSFGYNDRLE